MSKSRNYLVAISDEELTSAQTALKSAGVSFEPLRDIFYRNLDARLKGFFKADELPHQIEMINEYLKNNFNRDGIRTDTENMDIAQIEALLAFCQEDVYWAVFFTPSDTGVIDIVEEDLDLLFQKLPGLAAKVAQPSG